MTSLKKRNVVACVLLGFVTFGISWLIWEWSLIVGLAEAAGPNNVKLPGIAQYALTFCYVGYPIYGWCANTEVAALQQSRGIPAEDNMVLFIVLGVFCPIALLAIVQNKVNALVG